MRFLLILLIAGCFAGYLLPGQREGASTPCAALERRVRMLLDEELARLPPSSDPRVRAALDEARAGIPSGAALGQLVRAHVAMLPPEAACAAGYWATIVRPELLRTFMPLPVHRPAG